MRRVILVVLLLAPLGWLGQLAWHAWGLASEESHPQGFMEVSVKARTSPRRLRARRVQPGISQLVASLKAEAALSQRRTVAPLRLKAAAVAADDAGLVATSSPAPTGVETKVETPSLAKHEKEEEPGQELFLSDQANEQTLTAWRDEKEQFYRENLQLSDEEIEHLAELYEGYGEQVQDALTASEIALGVDDGGVLMRQLQAITDAYKADTRQLLGPTRFAAAIKFQQAFNQSSRDRFGSNVRVTGF